MKKTRLWLAAPALALSLLAVPMMEAEASQVTSTNGGAIVTEIIETDRAVMNAGIKVKDAKEAAALIAKDLKQISATTTFTMEYKGGIDKIEKEDKIKKEVEAIVTEARGMDEYVYGMGAGYALSLSYSDTTYTATLSYNYHLLSKSFEKKDLGDGTYELIFHQELHADDMKSVQAKEKEITAYVKEVAADLFTKDMSDFEKVKAAYDFVIVNTTYGTTPKPGYGAGHSPYSIVKDGVGVCQAYALLFQRLMDEAGVESKYVVGERIVSGYKDKKEGHAWNVVTIDGKTYHIDTTHGDPVAEHLSKDYISYQTFLLTEEQIKKRGHIITEKRPYTKPTSNLYSTWHEVEEPMMLGEFMYYTVLEGTFVQGDITYGKYAFKQGKVNLKTGALTSKTVTNERDPQKGAVSQQHLTKFNNKLFFANYNDGAILWVVKEDGTFTLMSDVPAVGKIQIVNDELRAYDYYNPAKIVYREQKVVEEQKPKPEPEKPTEPEKPVEPTPEPEKPTEPEKPVDPKPEPEKPTVPGKATEAEVNENFKENSPVVQKIEATKTAAAFKALLVEFNKFLDITIQNKQLEAFQHKVRKYNGLQIELTTMTTWTKTKPKVESPKKPWSIEFNAVVHKDSEKQLYVTDIFGEKLKANVEATGKIVTVTPMEEYVKGAEYYLIIPKDVKSTTGEDITKAISVPFTFE